MLFSAYQEAGATQFLLIQPNAKEPLRDPDTGSWRMADVAAAFQHWLGGGNVAIVPAWIGAVVLDFDPLPGCRIEISHALEVLASAGITKTPVALSPGEKHEGGAHFYLKDPGPEWDIKLPEFNIPNLDHIDIRRRNYVLLPPSTINGKEYQWYDDGQEAWALGTVGLAEVPAQWLAPAKAGSLEAFTVGANLEAAIERLAQACRPGDAEFIQQALTGDWPENQADGVDRSAAEYRLARICEEAKLTPAEASAIVEASAVHQAKFASRKDERERLVAVVEKAFSQSLPTSGRKFEVYTFAELEPYFSTPQFLIYPLLPRGEVTILDGDDGGGKSWLWQALAAGLTGSDVVPVPCDHTAPRNCKVIVITCEDDPLTTVGPRLKALGANLALISIIKPAGGKYVDGITAQDLSEAAETIKSLRPDLIVVDHLTLFASGRPDLDTRRDTHARALIDGLKALAKETGAAILLLRHIRKERGSAKDRGLNSVAFRATARSHLVVGPDPNDSTGKRRLLKQVKMNLVPALREAIAFTLDPGSNPPFSWSGLVEASADELVATEGETQAIREERTEREEAKAFLQEILADGPKLVEVVAREAERLHISKTTLKRARLELGVRAYQVKGAYPPQWVYELPHAGGAR
ncbi:MAG TPA: hypothetical protein DEA73_05215 [Peptococcaceae bacterium]|nr:hypothetical protein [Peptococcaceae bacterium]